MKRIVVLLFFFICCLCISFAVRCSLNIFSQDLGLNIGDKVGSGDYDYTFPNPEKIINFGEEDATAYDCFFLSKLFLVATIEKGKQMLEDLGNAISQEASEIFTLLDEVNGGIATLDKMAKKE